MRMVRFVNNGVLAIASFLLLHHFDTGTDVFAFQLIPRPRCARGSAVATLASGGGIGHHIPIRATALRSTAAAPDDAAAAMPPSILDITPRGPARPSPLSLNVSELTQELGAGKGRAIAAWDCYKIGVDPLLYYDPDVPDAVLDESVTRLTGSESTTRDDVAACLPVKRQTEGLGRAALKRLSALCGEGGVEGTVATLSHIRTSRDGTTKLLLKMAADGLEVETVIIPWEERGRSTLCLSSQVGCRQGCTFCATGRMGRLRSLSSCEILAQVYFSRKVCRVLNIPSVDNVVFMGMGEPADNHDAVVRAAKILTDRQLFQMAQSRVTISTVAPDPDAFKRLGEGPAMLAWSVHASRDELRKQLVPTTKFTMNELRRGFIDALLLRPKKLRTVMLEVALIDGVNDGDKEAEHLADFALEMIEEVPGMKLVVNLIPFNDIGHPTFRKPSLERVRRYQEKLLARGIFCYVRSTRGDDESAACGQLATKRKPLNK